MKKIYKIILIFNLLPILIGINFQSFSQTAPGIEWQKTFGGTDQDQAISVQQTSDGGFIVAGWTGSDNGDVSGNHGGADYWLIKLDALGNLQWQKCYGGSYDDLGTAVKEVNDGGYVITGISRSNDSNVTGNHGQQDLWTVKTDSIGNLQWQKSYGGTNGDLSYSNILQTNDSGFITVATTASNDGDINGGNHGVWPTLDYWVVKTDTSGNIQWQKCFGGTNTDYGHSIAKTPDNGYILTGQTWSNDGDVTGYIGGYDFWTIKIDSSGNLLWEKCSGGTNVDKGLSAYQTPDKGYIISGFTWSNDSDVTANQGESDFWIGKMDSSRNLLWQRNFGGTLQEEALSMYPCSDGGYVITGTTESINGDVTGNSGGKHSWTIKVDSTGNLKWQKCIGSGLDDAAASIIQTSDGGYVFVGTKYYNFSYDYWIVKLFPDTITGISQLPQLPNYPITIFPNPLTTQSKLTFKNNNKEKFLFTLYDITGRITESVSTATDEIILSKGSKQAGVYLFNLMNKKTGEKMNGKMVISN